MSTQNRASIKLKDLPVYDLENMVDEETGRSVSRGGVACPFPWRLHECLDAVESEGLEHIISWQSHGRSFTVYQPKKFAELVMPRFFGQTRYASFQRQLNIYGFSRFSQGRDKGAYFHLCFVRGNRSAVRQMTRCKIKGGKGARQSKLTCPEDFDFHHPAWQGHKDASIPPALTENSGNRVVSPVNSSESLNTSASLKLSCETVSSSRNAVLDPLTLMNAANQMLKEPCTTVSGARANVGAPVSDDDFSMSADDFAFFESFPLLDAGLEPTPLLEPGSPGMLLVDPVHNIYTL